MAVIISTIYRVILILLLVPLTVVLFLIAAIFDAIMRATVLLTSEIIRKISCRSAMPGGWLKRKGRPPKLGGSV